MSDKDHITQEELKEILDLKDDGTFVWKSTRHNRVKIGSIAGHFHKAKKYWKIEINQKEYLAHRLVWLWHHGSLPQELDHIDNDRLNNRIENLRVANRSENMWNQKARNKTGLKGIFFAKDRNKWRALIAVNNKKIHLGQYDNPEDAANAYKVAANKYHGEFANY